MAKSKAKVRTISLNEEQDKMLEAYCEKYKLGPSQAIKRVLLQVLEVEVHKPTEIDPNEGIRWQTGP